MTARIALACPDCYAVSVPLDGVVLVHVNRTVRATFICPSCAVPASSSLHPAYPAHLVEKGVPLVILPPEEKPAARGELTDAEVDRYVEQIESSTFIAWLAGAK